MVMKIAAYLMPWLISAVSAEAEVAWEESTMLRSIICMGKSALLSRYSSAGMNSFHLPTA